MENYIEEDPKQLINKFYNKYPGFKTIPKFNSLFLQYIALYIKINSLIEKMVTQGVFIKETKNVSQEITRLLEQLEKVSLQLEKLILYGEKISPANWITQGDLLYHLSSQGKELIGGGRKRKS